MTPTIRGSPTTSGSPIRSSGGGSRPSGASSSPSRRSSCEALVRSGRRGPLGARHAGAARRARRRRSTGARRAGLRRAARGAAPGRRVRPAPRRGRVGRSLAAAAGRVACSRGARRVAVLQKLDDHENLGGCSATRPRSASTRCCSTPSAPIRSTAAACGSRSGTCCTVPWTRLGVARRAARAGFTLFALTPAPDATPLDAVDWPERSRCCSARRARACRRGGSRRPTRGSASRCSPASTRSTSRPPPRSRSTRRADG